MNASKMIEQKVGAIAAASAESLARELELKGQLRCYFLELNADAGVNIQSPTMAAKIADVSGSVFDGVVGYLMRVSGAEKSDLLRLGGQQVLDASVAYIQRHIEPKLRDSYQKRHAAFVSNLAGAQVPAEIVAMVAKDRADERVKIMQALEIELAEIEAAPARKS